MSLYDTVVITRPEFYHRELKGTKAIITGINRSQEDYPGYDPAMDGLPLFDLVAEDGQSIFDLVYMYEVTPITEVA